MDNFKRIEVTQDMYDLIFDNTVFKMADMIISPIDKSNVLNLFQVTKEMYDMGYVEGYSFCFKFYDYESNQWYKTQFVMQTAGVPRDGIKFFAKEFVKKVLPIYFKVR